MKDRVFQLCDAVRETSLAIHKYLGPGHLEKVYENALAHRLRKQGFDVKQQFPLTVHDEDGTILGQYAADIIVEHSLILELKAARGIADEHVAQLLGYLRASRMEHGLLVNFGASKFYVKKYVMSDPGRDSPSSQLLSWLLSFLLFAILCILCGRTAVAASLTPEESQRLEAAQAAAKKTPELKAATAKFNAARKAYQLDRDKFPAERDRDVAIRYRQATKEFEQATRQAILAQDPTLGPLLDKAALAKRRGPTSKGAMNEGETVADSDVAANPAIRAIKDVPGLPRVLLIGDSISIGYTLEVRELLQGRANVHRIPVNGGATEVGLEKLQGWLGDGRWDVIHFNFGLHDAKYASETTQRSSREQYADNLRMLVQQMKPTGAKLIFATTTPVPNDGMLSPTRKFDSIPARNEIAVKVMQENGVAIDDLNAAVLPVQEKVGRPNDVHYAPEGYAVLAKAVAASIAAQLPAKPAKHHGAEQSKAFVPQEAQK